VACVLCLLVEWRSRRGLEERHWVDPGAGSNEHAVEFLPGAGQPGATPGAVAATLPQETDLQRRQRLQAHRRPRHQRQYIIHTLSTRVLSGRTEPNRTRSLKYTYMYLWHFLCTELVEHQFRTANQVVTLTRVTNERALRRSRSRNYGESCSSV